MIKLIACDVDGTLLDNNGCLHNETKKAIQRAQENNIDFLICTGRSYCELSYLLNEHSLKVEAICLNGSNTVDIDGTSIDSFFVDSKYVDIVDKVAKQNHLIVEYHSLYKTYLTCSKEELFKKHCQFNSFDYNDEKERENFNNFWYFEDEWYSTSIEKIKKDKVTKIEFIYLSQEEYQNLFAHCMQFDLNVTSGCFLNNIELNHKESSKGNALVHYCKLKDIQNEEVIVIGDSLNDSSMFQLYKNSVVMENAKEDIKKLARYQTSSNENLGVVKVIDGVIYHNQNNK